MPARRHRSLMTGLVACLVMFAGLFGVIVTGIPGGPSLPLPWEHRVTLHVRLHDADGLAANAGVEIAGVKVGEVRNITTDGQTAEVTIVVDAAQMDLHQDAGVLLRPHGLFGPKYLEFQPGSGGSPRLRDGDTVPQRQTVQPVDLDQVLHELQAPEQQNLRTVIVELGRAMTGRGGDLHALVQSTDQLTASLRAPVDTLNSVRGNLGNLLVDNASVADTLATTPLDQTLAHSNQVLATFAANSAPLGSLLQHADATLSRLDEALGGQAANIRASLEALPGVIDQLDKFNGLVSLFAANLSGREPGTSDVIPGIIAAIENVRSAFGSYNLCTPGTPDCDQSGRSYYLKVQIVGLLPYLPVGQFTEGVCKALPLPALCPTTGAQGKSAAAPLPAGDSLTPLGNFLGS